MEIKETLKKISKLKLGKDKFILIALVGLLLFVIALPTGNSGKQKNNQNTNVLKDSGEVINTGDTVKNDTYTQIQEERLALLLQEMEGVGKVKVMLTIERGEQELILSEESKTESTMSEKDAAGGERNSKDYTSEKQTVYGQDSSGNNVPYVVQTIEPVIGGVVVIAEGGGNDDIRKSITEVVQALFDIEAHKIKVVKMKSL